MPLSLKEMEERLLDLRDVIVRVKKTDKTRADHLVGCLDCGIVSGCTPCFKRPASDDGNTID